MLIDNNLILSNAQAVTSTAVSTNVVDQGAAADAVARAPYVEFLVNTSFTASGSATMQLELQDSADNSTFNTVLITEAIPKATLVAGYRRRFKLPPGVRRYIAANYTVATGPMTAGKIDARIVEDVDVLV